MSQGNKYGEQFKYCLRVLTPNLYHESCIIFIYKSDPGSSGRSFELKNRMFQFWHENCAIVSYTLFFIIRTSNFRLSLGCSKFFGDFSLKLFLNCSYFLRFLNSELFARNNTCKMALRNMCLLLFHPAKKLETVNICTASANVTSLACLSLPAPDDQAKF